MIAVIFEFTPAEGRFPDYMPPAAFAKFVAKESAFITDLAQRIEKK